MWRRQVCWLLGGFQLNFSIKPGSCIPDLFGLWPEETGLKGVTSCFSDKKHSED
jgi:hypothetical protein